MPSTPDVLVDAGTSDDAGVFRLTVDLAIVQTLDYFTPIVDDAATWGRIAATNALSDVYAMGGSPVTAMNIVGWPRDALGWDVLGEVLDGAVEVLDEAGCALLGGHSIDDPEPKFGLSVTGVVDPQRILRNSAGEVGDVLVLTKPLGVGVLTTAVKRGLLGPDAERVAVDTMLRSNRQAAEVAAAAGLRCATDVTGFGLLGHLSEVLRASGTAAVIDMAAVPVIEGVREAVELGAVAGGTQRNLGDTSSVDWGCANDLDRVVLCDAQTSGGLLLAVPPGALETVTAALGADVARVIGELTDHEPASPLVRIT